MNPDSREAPDKMLSEKFNRKLKEWGSDIPDILINDFLLQNKEILKLKEVDVYWRDKNLRDFCFDTIRARNNDKNQNNENKEHKEIDMKKKKELYEALVKYTTKKETEFREKEKKKEGSRETLKSERDEILRFVRAREALKDSYGNKKFVQTVNEQKIRDAKIVKKLTGKT